MPVSDEAKDYPTNDAAKGGSESGQEMSPARNSVRRIDMGLFEGGEAEVNTRLLASTRSVTHIPCGKQLTHNLKLEPNHTTYSIHLGKKNLMSKVIQKSDRSPQYEVYNRWHGQADPQKE